MRNRGQSESLGCCHVAAPTGNTWFPNIEEDECHKLSIHAAWTPGPCPQHLSLTPNAKGSATEKGPGK